MTTHPHSPAVSTLIRLGKLPSSGRPGALHNAATEAVFDSLMKYANEWSRAPIASRSKQQKHLSVLSQSEDLDVLRHLSINRALDKLDAQSTVEKTNDNQVRLGLAAHQLDSQLVIERIIETQSGKNCWKADLEKALNPTTRAKELEALHRDARELCVSGAIARHQRCPKPIAKYFGWYLPVDLKSNLKFGLAILENLPVPEEQFSDRTISHRLRQKTAQAYLSKAAAKQRCV